MENKIGKSILDLEIVDYTHTGQGIAKNNGEVIFINDAIVGEIVDVKIYKYDKKIAYAKVINFKKKSLNRVEPICKHYNECGGCDIMHLNYEEQISLKKRVLSNIFYKNKLNEEVFNNLEIIDSQNILAYRNKVTFSFLKVNDKICLGFNKKKTNDVVQIKYCELISENMNDIKDIFLEQLNMNYKIDNLNKLVIRENEKGEIFLLLEVSTKNINTSFYDVIAKNLLNNNIVNFSIMYKYNVLKEYKKKDFIVTLNDRKFLLSANSFFQVNTFQTIKLYDEVSKLISEDSVNVLDAYSGVGSIGMYVYKDNMRLHGFEIVKEAVDNAKSNLKLNNIINAKYECLDLERYAQNSSIKFDTVIVDPPRKGISKKFMEYLLNSKAKEIIYISCSHKTLARDLNILREYYNIVFFKGCDMFSQTSHIESICKLELK